MLIFPSECYETCPLTIIEAFGTGLPVVASNRGAMPSMVRDRDTGVLFTAGNPESLAEKVLELHHNPSMRRFVSRNARAEFERLYTRERHYEGLLRIYQAATEERSRS